MAKASYDVVIIGAGAAGMMCAAVAGARGKRVLLIDHAKKLAEKIRISGGGRCNFTNIGASWQNFMSANPAFCRSALSAYTPQDFLALVRKHRIAYHEKHRGQLFCDESSEQIIQMLKQECDDAHVSWRMACQVEKIEHQLPLREVGARTNAQSMTASDSTDSDSVASASASSDAASSDAAALAKNSTSSAATAPFIIHTSSGVYQAKNLVIATGGMAIPQLGASDYGLKVARQFGLKVIEPRPALVPLVFDAQSWKRFADLSGVSLEVIVSCGQGKQKTEFLEDVLFTHRGLSGPGILQISSYWDGTAPIRLNLAPQEDLAKALLEAKPGNKQKLLSVLSSLWPKRLAQSWMEQEGLSLDLRLADMPDKQIRALAQQIHEWTIVPSGTAGFKKAEAMKGGVDTAQINQKTMQAKQVPGLYFIGEVLDVTGWLGGYNFQWAWASGVACGRSIE
ncbi:MAG: NAD(P)/FAD-dependent oxidoreductase [Pelistega sp.]|nr:NAD(P)/FAD-dependent oxidoreductase [Pelistega sp.]